MSVVFLGSCHEKTQLQLSSVTLFILIPTAAILTGPPLSGVSAFLSVSPGQQSMEWHTHSQGRISENLTKNVELYYCIYTEDSSGPCLGLSSGEI